MTKHTVSIEAWADTLNECNALLAQVRTQLDGYQGGQIHRAFATDPGQGEQEDNGYHKTATYTVWTANANITPTTDSTAVIQTGNEFAEIRACDHTLRLDCDGLTLDGDVVGGMPDLSDYARKDAANTFSQGQTITAPASSNRFDPSVGQLQAVDPATGQVRFSINYGTDQVTRFVVQSGDGGGDGITNLRLAIEPSGFTVSSSFIIISSAVNNVGFYCAATNQEHILYGNTLYHRGGEDAVKYLVFQAPGGQTQDLFQFVSPSQVKLSGFGPNGEYTPPQLADSAAANNSVYYSTTQSKLAYKDTSGTVNMLY